MHLPVGNPYLKFLLLVPVEDVLPIDVSVGDGMKMLISGGAVTPPKKKGKGRGRGRRKPRSAEKKSEVVSKESTGRPRRRSPRKPKAEET